LLRGPKFGKTYEYVNLKRLRDAYVAPVDGSMQIDEKTLKKEHTKAKNDVLFSVQGIQRKESAISKRNRLQRKPFNMPSKEALSKMWDMMPAL
jgi:hypothetical protein